MFVLVAFNVLKTNRECVNTFGERGRERVWVLFPNVFTIFFFIPFYLLTVCHKHKSSIRTMHRVQCLCTHARSKIIHSSLLKCVVFKGWISLGRFARVFSLSIILLLLLSLFNPVSGTRTLCMYKIYGTHNNIAVELSVAQTTPIAQRWIKARVQRERKHMWFIKNSALVCRICNEKCQNVGCTRSARSVAILHWKMPTREHWTSPLNIITNGGKKSLNEE